MPLRCKLSRPPFPSSERRSECEVFSGHSSSKALVVQPRKGPDWENVGLSETSCERGGGRDHFASLTLSFSH